MKSQKDCWHDVENRLGLATEAEDMALGSLERDYFLIKKVKLNIQINITKRDVIVFIVGVTAAIGIIFMI